MPRGKFGKRGAEKLLVLYDERQGTSETRPLLHTTTVGCRKLNELRDKACPSHEGRATEPV